MVSPAVNIRARGRYFLSQQTPNLRQRARQAVQREMSEAAHRLFLERGFEATTIDDIAAAAGMSPRSVFRYFKTKEELVIGKLDFAAEDMLAILHRRPVDEPIWLSLRRMFDVFDAMNDPEKRRVAESVMNVVFETPALLASYLSKLQQIQDMVVASLIERARAGTPFMADDPAPRALTAAAFGCLVAAQYSWLAGDVKSPFGNALDRAMRAVEAVGPARI